MKAVIAQMKHETNTFSPVPTPLFVFGKNGPYFGSEAYRAMHGTATPMGAFIELCRENGAEIVTPVAGDAPPSGPVAREAYSCMCEAILESVRQGCDALFLDLHGAMVVENSDDGEGDLLERIRELAPTLAIAVALDLHANITDKMVRNCDVIAGYKTYPHVDMYQAGVLAGSVLMRYLRGEVKPVMAWGSRPLLAQTLCMATADYPMCDFIQAARDAEKRGMLAATAFGGFPQTDVPATGVSAVVVADGDAAGARAECEAMLDLAWERRADFIYQPNRWKNRSRARRSFLKARCCCSITAITAHPGRRRTPCKCSPKPCAKGLPTSASDLCAIRKRSRRALRRVWARA